MTTRAPRRRAFKPGEYDAGQVIVWTYYGASMTAERIGTIWSAGPDNTTLWVIPDERLPGEGPATVVRVWRSGRFKGRAEQRWSEPYMIWSRAEWQRDAWPRRGVWGMWEQPAAA